MALWSVRHVAPPICCMAWLQEPRERPRPEVMGRCEPRGRRWGVTQVPLQGYWIVCLLYLCYSPRSDLRQVSLQMQQLHLWVNLWISGNMCVCILVKIINVNWKSWSCCDDQSLKEKPLTSVFCTLNPRRTMQKSKYYSNSLVLPAALEPNFIAGSNS